MSSTTVARTPIVAIGGGVGPLAGLECHQLLLRNTVAQCDQDHLEVHHSSRSRSIPDRTEFVLGRSKENPAYEMARTVGHAVGSARYGNQSVVFGVPCNTFHSPPIWSVFAQEVAKQFPAEEVKLLHLVEEVVRFVREILPGLKRVGVLSTSGSRQSKVMENAFVKIGVEVLQVPEEMQDTLHEAIYSPVYGLKTAPPVTERARQEFHEYAELLVKDGAQALILACTEIPLAFDGETSIKSVPLIDPMCALARAFIREVEPDKLCDFHLPPTTSAKEESESHEG